MYNFHSHLRNEKHMSSAQGKHLVLRKFLYFGIFLSVSFSRSLSFSISYIRSRLSPLRDIWRIIVQKIDFFFILSK